jgi:hypothetical protein
MTVTTDWSIEIPVEEVFEAQQADMGKIRQRRPELYELTLRAARDAQAVLRPVVIRERRKVIQLVRSRLFLEGGYQLSGRFVTKHFAAADEVSAVVCSIGADLENLVSRSLSQDKTAYAYALDAAGSVALNHLTGLVCRELESEAEKAGKKVTSRYGPGIHSWPISVGQPQLFAILPEAGPYVQLAPNMQMLPYKSVSFVVGMGAQVTRDGSECDDCDARERCTFRQAYR